VGEKDLKMESEVVGWPSVLSDDLVQRVGPKICKRRRFTISEFSCEFTQISRTILYEIIIVRLGNHKFCSIWVPKILMGAHKTQSFDFLERYHKDVDEFLNHIVRVTCDETLVSFVNVETKRQSKQ
jgi:hypothetical protein